MLGGITTSGIHYEIIKNICSEGQIAELEKSKVYNPRLEASARALKDYCGVDEPNSGYLVSIMAIRKLAKVLNVDLRYNFKRFPPSTHALAINTNGEKYIVVDVNLDEQTKRFKICHELAHFILDHRQLALNDAYDSKTPFKNFRKYLKYEYEANYLAAAILMDERKLKKIIYDNNKSGHKFGHRDSILRIAEEFDVSYETAAHRYCTKPPPVFLDTNFR